MEYRCKNCGHEMHRRGDGYSCSNCGRRVVLHSSGQAGETRKGRAPTTKEKLYAGLHRASELGKSAEAGLKSSVFADEPIWERSGKIDKKQKHEEDTGILGLLK